MVKNEYPSSYSSDVEKMGVKELNDLLDYLDSIKGKADGGRVGMLSGGLLKHGIMSAIEQIKNMDEGNLFSKLDPLGKARTIKDALIDRIDGFKEIIKDLKTQGRPIDEIEDMKFEMDEAKDGLKKINEYIENQPTTRTLQADGGSVGIEVLFNKRKEFKKGGRGRQDRMGGTMEQTAAELMAAAPDQFAGGMNISHGGGGDGPANVIIPKKKPITPIIKDDNPPWYSPGQLINNPLLNFINPKSKIGMGLNLFKTLKNFQPTDEDVTLGKTSEVTTDLPDNTLFAEVIDKQKDVIGKKIDHLNKGYIDTQTLYDNTKIFDDKGSTGVWGIGAREAEPMTPKEFNEEIKNQGYTGTDFIPEVTMTGKDGGRVGFQLGGWAEGLTGEAKGIYDSMTAYGASDDEIQAKLQAQNLWSPGGTPDSGNTGQVTGLINQNIGGDDRKNSYETFNYDTVKNYGPGGMYELPPESIGMSFFEQPGSAVETYGQGVDLNKARSFEENKALIEAAGGIDKIGKPVEKNFIGKTIDAFTSVPNKMSSQFEIRPGVTPKGPQELGFMTREIEGLPGITREDIRSQYDNYSPFWGRTSNYPNARVKGKAGQLWGSLAGGLMGIPFVGPGLSKLGDVFGSSGPKSDTARWAVDNAGFGQGTQRDQFGTYTGGKTLFGKTENYKERMENKIADIAESYGYSLNDLMSLDEDTLNALGKRNKNRATLVKDYVTKIGVIDKQNIQKQNDLQKVIDEENKIAAEKARNAKIAADMKYHNEHTPTSAGGMTYNEIVDAMVQDRSESRRGRPGGIGGKELMASGGRAGLATMFTRRR